MGKKFTRGGTAWNTKSREFYMIGACIQKEWSDCINRGNKCVECIQIMGKVPSCYEKEKSI